jgi:hypothetical protein
MYYYHYLAVFLLIAHISTISDMPYSKIKKPCVTSVYNIHACLRAQNKKQKGIMGLLAILQNYLQVAVNNTEICNIHLCDRWASSMQVPEFHLKDRWVNPLRSSYNSRVEQNAHIHKNWESL